MDLQNLFVSAMYKIFNHKTRALHNDSKRMAVQCWIVDKNSKLKKGHNSDKNAIRVIPLDSIVSSNDSEHIFRVSRKYLLVIKCITLIEIHCCFPKYDLFKHKQ